MQTLSSTSLIESDSFEFEFVSHLAEMESWRKEIYRPIYHVHKWWATRLGSVFRSILLGCVLRDSDSLQEAFYRNCSFDGFTVFDPFVGSGTTVGEAHKLGFTALGRDINPVAIEAVRVALGPLDRNALMDAFGELSSNVGEKIRGLYRAKDAEGQPCDVLYYFWVKMVPCPCCSADVDLFSSYIFARNAYPNHKPEVRVYCPACAGVFRASINDTATQCPHCKLVFDLHDGPAKGASSTCRSCKQEFTISKAIRATGCPPAHRMYAKLVLTSNGDKQYLSIGPEDVQAYELCSESLSKSGLALPKLKLEDGVNTRQVLNYGYQSWRQFFNDRQLLALGLLHEAILGLQKPAVRDAMLLTFSGALEFNNMFASYKGEGTGAVRHMFSHHILKPERTPIEGNVWGTAKSSGSFSTLFKSRLIRAIAYRAAPFEIAVKNQSSSQNRKRIYGVSNVFSGHVDTQWPPNGLQNRRIHLSCGDSSKTGLPDATVDFVVTDPPFFDNVHYSELADFFFAWQQLARDRFPERQASTRHPAEVQDSTAEGFSAKLRAVFKECYRVLKESGLLVFTYHHSRTEGWSALADAVLGAGFAFTNCHPVKSEMSVAAPKAQAKEPIQIDVILTCRKQALDSRPTVPLSDAFKVAIERAVVKAKRLEGSGIKLSRNDRRVLLIGQFLVEMCAGREGREVAEAVIEHSEKLDMALVSLSAERTSIKYDEITGSIDPQLILLEQASKLFAT